MLYELEWQTPHETPFSGTVEDWVKSVKWFEANNWLRDPLTIEWPEGPDHPANEKRRRDDEFCPLLCWRERCKRMGRCPHFLALGIREFMPEFSVHCSNLVGLPQVYLGPVNPDKMDHLATVFGKAEKPAANPLSHEPLRRPLTDYWNLDEET